MHSSQSSDSSPPDSIAAEAETQKQQEAPNELFPIVGIVASAGGLEAFTQLLSHLPINTGMAFVLIQHLAPNQKSLLTEILAKTTQMPVEQVQNGVSVQQNHVYIIPPNTKMMLAQGVLQLMPREKIDGKYMPGDVFFTSLAAELGSKAISVVLSGSDGDGARGSEAIKAAGGITFAQCESSAQFSDMPNTAIATGNVDFILPPPKIAEELAHIARHPKLTRAISSETVELPESQNILPAIFAMLSTATGVDFSHYKQTTLKRRIDRRMVLYKLERLEDYVQYLQENPDEVQALYHEILISVTSFFRDPEAYQALKERVFPAIAKGKSVDLPIRIWVSGCATGEEVYSIAICLLEFLEDVIPKPAIQIFATDINETAIEKARLAIYKPNQIVDISPERLRRFFTAQEILPAIQAGLILPQSDTYKIPLALTESEATSLKLYDVQVNYKFLHDRVQQAAYSFIPDSEKKVTHQKIGQLMLKNTILQEQQDSIFTLVNQLNFGRDLIINFSEKYELAKLNLVAGQKAKMATAYEAAINYFHVGLELLELDSSKEDDLFLVLYLEISEAQYLNTNFSEAARLCNIALKQVNTLLTKIKFYEIKIRIALAENHIQLAIEIGLQVLEMLKVSLCQSSPQDLNLDELAKLPRMTDPYKLAAMEILMLIHPPACFGESTLGLTILYTMIELSRQYGNSPPSIYAYADYGALVSWHVPDIDLAYQLGQLAWLVLAQLDAKQFQCQLLVTISINITHWKKHTKETIEPLFDAIQSGLEVGDIQFACYAAHYYSIYLFFTGFQLQYMQDNQKRYINFIKTNKQEHQLFLIKIFSQLVANLICKSGKKLILDGEFINEIENLLVLQANNNYLALFSLYFAKCFIYYLFKHYSESLEYAIIGSNCSEFIQGEIIFVQHNFYYSLALLGQYCHAICQENLGYESKHEQFLMQVERNQYKLKYWAHNCPMNYQHKYELVEAEKARILGQILKAMEYYDCAIQGARVQGYIQEEALAYERAAEFYLGLGREEIAQLYMKNAHDCYTRWGAIAKVKDLESEYPQFLAEVTNQIEVEGTSPTFSTTSSDSEILDLTTVIKASQTLASEIVLEKLLQKLMQLVIENAGAEKGFIILEREGHWVIEAHGTVDSDDVNILQSIPVDSGNSESQIPLVSTAIINYVARTQENIVLNDAVAQGQFTRDSYIVATQSKSILCTPLVHKGKLSGILYLENNLTTGAFTSDRVEILKILSAQAAISIENSRLYEQLEGYSRTLEQKVKMRTQELEEKNQDLANLLQKLKATQAQIIAQEKLASLGALTAGIAHEIKNPLNFVNNFAELSVELTQELLEEIENQQDRLDSESREYIEEILNDLKQNAKKINEHGKRADNIVHGMLMHSRGQTGDRQPTDINAMLAEAISLTYHGMRAKDTAFNIVIETNYDDKLGLINIVPQNISRAFINIINNACYTAYKKKIRFQAEYEAEGFSPTLIVSTRDLGEQVEIQIRDNGEGISQELRGQIFHPFFTTKPPGEGTGLGLSITHDIIVQQHQGNIRVESEVNCYTLFILSLPKTYPYKKQV